jgi:hypothetical protein
VISAGTSFSCGGVVSVTSTAKTAGADVLFDASFAVQEACVVPRGNPSPELLLQDTVGEGSTASAAVAAKVTVAPLGSVASFVTVPGVVRVGATRSTTVMSKVPGADVLPDASVAVHETVVVPSGNICPEE